MISWTFRTEDNELGFFQHRDEHLHIYIKSKRFFSDVRISKHYNTTLLEEDNEEIFSAKEVKSIIKTYLDRSDKGVNSNIVDISKNQYPGTYYPRISKHRVGFNYVSQSFLQDMRAYQNIQSSLDGLFDYVEPSEENFTSYGHKIRELLILACTEVEYLLQKVLTDNMYPEAQMYRTRDYIKCKDILKLDKYEVSLNQYSELSNFKPFDGWDFECPTQSLKWYSAYNAVKHNRGGTIKDANLENLLYAISAIHILLESQYGEGIFSYTEKRTRDDSIFNTVERPMHACAEISAPLLSGSDEIELKWTEPRLYFQDNTD